MNNLILCSGRTHRAGWKTLDANPLHEPDYICKIPPLREDVKAISWNEIEWIHGITSFYPWEAEIVLRELASCIAPEGKLILEQPDLSRIPFSHPQWIFGDPKLKDPLHMNKWAYTPTSLAYLLAECGFRSKILPAKYHVPERDFRIEARLL